NFNFQLCKFFLGEEGEPAEVTDHVSVGCVDEVLVPSVWAGHFRIQPEASAAGGLAELLAVGIGNQRYGHCVDRGAVDATVEVNARNDVAPLVTATYLQGAAEALVQFNVVVGL